MANLEGRFMIRAVYGKGASISAITREMTPLNPSFSSTSKSYSLFLGHPSQSCIASQPDEVLRCFAA